jgi:anti-anti-sigma factor
MTNREEEPSRERGGVGFLCSNDCRERHRVTVVSGVVDKTSAEQSLGAVVATMDRRGPALTVDLTAVTSMDGAGMMLLLFVHDECRRRGGHVAFLGAPAEVVTLLRRSGVDEVNDLRARIPWSDSSWPAVSPGDAPPA